MLTILRIRNIALIDSLEAEFGPGLNLLTGETGSGKSIIVDSLSALTGERVSSDLIKDGAETAHIEGLFEIERTKELAATLEESGIEFDETDRIELIVRRELSLSGKNRIYLNNQLVTATLLKRIAPYLVDIHGQGEQASLFDSASHLELLDEFAGTRDHRDRVTEAFHDWRAVKTELSDLKKDEAEKLQLIDILRFQVDELKRADLKLGENEELEEEKRRLNNVEKLSALSGEAFSLLYGNDESTAATLEKAARRIEELAEYDSRFRDYREGVENARAMIGDLSIAVRDFRGSIEFSPERLEEIENRLAETSQLTRKYGGSTESSLAHLEQSQKRLENIETAELREIELQRELAAKCEKYLQAADGLSEKRRKAAKEFAKEVEANLRPLALEKARFEVRIEAPNETEPSEKAFTENGFDTVEFYFSANAGEPTKPLAKVASGGEASRLMLILKTTAKSGALTKTAVFDEIDAGIGGRVSEAVGAKLKELARTQQVLCVTHQPQIASQADRHFLVEKEFTGGRTMIGIRELDKKERVEEIARMLAGEKITDAARANARVMLAGR